MRPRFLTPELVARAVAEAPVAGVWPLLADLARHPEWNPLIARVDGATEPPVGGERVHVAPFAAPAQAPASRLPVAPPRVAVDVAVVDAPHELGLVAYPLPGLTARLRFRLLPLPRGRTDLELRGQLAGALAAAHWPVGRLAAQAVLRSLATAAAGEPASAAGTGAAGPSRSHPCAG